MYELKTLLPQFEIQLPTCMYTLRNVNLSVDGSSGAACNGCPNAGQTCCVSEAQANIQFMPNVAVSKNAQNMQNAAKSSSASSSTIKVDSACFSNYNNKTTNSHCALDLDILGRQIQKLLKFDTAVIAVRQDKVMQQLDELLEQLAGIRSTLDLCQKGQQHTTQSSTHNGGLREEPLHDIVINGHPDFIPYALLALKNAWSSLFTIEVTTYTHSTMQDIGPEAREFEKKLSLAKVDPTKPKVKVTLIWKNCEHTEMISSPTMYVPIYGEVNIIRYLGRVGPSEYRYENSLLCNEIDAVLDICYQLLRCTTPNARAIMIRALNSRLKEQPYFGGEQMSVADIGVHSSLKRMPAITEKELTPALNEWRKRAQLVTML